MSEVGRDLIAAAAVIGFALLLWLVVAQLAALRRALIVFSRCRLPCASYASGWRLLPTGSLLRISSGSAAHCNVPSGSALHRLTMNCRRR